MWSEPRIPGIPATATSLSVQLDTSCRNVAKIASRKVPCRLYWIQSCATVHHTRLVRIAARRVDERPEDAETPPFGDRIRLGRTVDHRAGLEGRRPPAADRHACRTPPGPSLRGIRARARRRGSG